MNKKDAIVVFILAFLVALAATCRFFSVPLQLTGERARPQQPRRQVPQPAKGGLTPAITPSWPKLAQPLEPRDPAAHRLLDAAETVASEGLLHAALAAYNRFLERFPDEPAAELVVLRIGQCFTLLRRHTEAAESYELFLTRYPKSPYRPMALLWSGDALAHLGQPELARTRLQEVVDRHADSPFAEGAKALLSALETPPKAPAPLKKENPE